MAMLQWWMMLSEDAGITRRAASLLLLRFGFSSKPRFTQPTQLIARILFDLAIFANCDGCICALLFADLEHRLGAGA